MWLVLYIVVGLGALFLMGCVLAIHFIRKLIAIIPHTTFMSGCEIAALYNETYRPLIFDLDALIVEQLLEPLEKAKVVTGRDPVPVRCYCPREYCRTRPGRRRRRWRERTQETVVTEGKIV